MYLYFIQAGLEVYDNHIHNSTSYGIYTQRLQYGSASDPYEFKRNIFADNNYGFYSYGYSSSSYNRYFVFEDNTFRSSSNIQLYGYYYSYDWVIENNTFDGDSDSTYGTYLQRGNNAKVGNAFQESWNKPNIPTELAFSSTTKGASLLPKFDCHCSVE